MNKELTALLKGVGMVDIGCRFRSSTFLRASEVLAICAILVVGCSTPQEQYAAARRALLAEKQKFDKLYAEGGQEIERDINAKAVMRVVNEFTGLDMQRVALHGDTAAVNLKDFRARHDAGEIDNGSFGVEALRIFDTLHANRLDKERIVETLKRVLEVGTQEQRRFDEAFFELMDETPAARPIRDQMLRVGRAYDRMSEAAVAAGISIRADDVREYYWFHAACFHRDFPSSGEAK